MSPASAPPPIELLTSPMAIIVRSGSASSDDSTTITPEIIFTVLTSLAIFFIIIGCIFRRRDRKALAQSLQQHEETTPSPVPDLQPQVMTVLSPPISHNTSVRLSRNDDRLQVPTSIERGDLVLGLQRALLESQQMRMQQEAAEGTTDTNANNPGWGVPGPVAHPDPTRQYTQEYRNNASILSHDHDSSISPHHDTVSEQDGHETPGLASGSSLLSGSTQSLGAVSPYRYRVNNLSSGFESDHNDNGIPSEHVFPPSQSPQLVLSLAHAHLLSNSSSEEPEGFDHDSIIIPSKISFEDSLLPPEYQSAWRGGESR